MDLIQILEGIGKKKEEILVDIAYGDICDKQNIEWLHKADKLIQRIMKKFLKNYSTAKHFGGSDFIDLEAVSHYKKFDVVCDETAEGSDLLLSLPKDRDSKTCRACTFIMHCGKLGTNAMHCQESKENAADTSWKESCANCQLYITSCCGEENPAGIICPGFIRGRIK